MQFVQHRPSGPLSAFIDQFWYRRGFVEHARRQRALPTGGADVTFNLEDGALRVFTDAADAAGESFKGAVVHGAHSRYFVLDARRDVHVIGVHFRPGGAVLLGLHGRDLTNGHASLDDLWGHDAHIVREQLLEAPTPATKLAVLELTFASRLHASRLIHPAVSFTLRGIQSAPGEARVETLQSSTGYGARRFNTLFSNDIGLAPKVYCRILRLRSVVESIAQRAHVDWAHLAAEFGYYDQSHLIRDFRAFTGVTPSEYRPVSASSALHMEIEESSSTV